MKKNTILMFLATIGLSTQVHAQDRSVDILYIGDSHSQGSFGKTLYDELTQNHSVANYAVSGSHPASWLPGASSRFRTLCSGAITRGDTAVGISHPQKNRCPEKKKKNAVNTPDFSVLLKTHKPKVAVIAQGSNLIGWSEAFVRKNVTAMLDLLKDSNTPCVWIAAPDAKDAERGHKRSAKCGPKKRLQAKTCVDDDLNLDEVNDVLEELVSGRCTFYKTASELAKEGLHYPAKGGGGMHFDGGFSGKYADEAKKYVQTWADRSRELIDASWGLWTAKSPASVKSSRSTDSHSQKATR